MEIRCLTNDEIEAVSGGRSRWEQRHNPAPYNPKVGRTVGTTIAAVGSVVIWIPHPVTVWGGQALSAAGAAMVLESMYL